MAMDYAAMMQSLPQVPSSFAVSHTNMQHHPRHPYSFPYNGEPVFMVPHIPHHRNISDPQAAVTHAKQTEPKPRLAKDEVELLENEFQKNPKPSSQRKREIADLLKVENPRINNWFQNRRAKAKQLLRREMDTRDAPSSESSTEQQQQQQQQPQQDDCSVSEYYASSSDSRPLQPSSAVFPAAVETQTQPQPQLSLYPSAQEITLPNSASSSIEEYPSPESLNFPAATQDVTAAAYAPAMSGFLGCPVPTAAANDGSLNSAADFNPSINAFVPMTTMSMEPVMAPVTTYQSDLLAVDDVQVQSPSVLSAFESLSQGSFIQQLSSPVSAAHSPSSAVSDLRFKSPPPPANIATRRSKGTAPAMLNSTALRNYPYGPKTGLDMGKRIDGPSPIRRIASASGIMANRIQKPGMTYAPRSPLYLERNKEAMMHSLQTSSVPLVRSLSTQVSPVLAVEAPVPMQHGAAAAAILATSSPEIEPQYALGTAAPQQAAFFSAGPTLKTPPGTPGFNATPVDQVNVEVPWNYVPQDDALLTPSLGSYGSDEFPMLPAAPAYAVSSQPPTPSLSQGLGPAYMPMRMQANGLGQSDYSFPGEAYTLPGSKMSPGRAKGKQFQFTPNVTPQDFFSGDK